MFCRKIAYRKLSESSDSSDTPTPTPKQEPENITHNSSSSNSNADNDRQRLEALIDKASAQLLITASQLLPAEQDDTVQTAALRQVVINMSVREFRKKMTNDMELYLKRRREDSKSKASSSASKKEEKSTSNKLSAIKFSRSPQIVLSSSSSDDTGTESTLLPDDDDDDDECGTMNDISGLPSCDVSPSSSIPFASLKFDHIVIQPDYLFPANFPPNNLPRNPLYYTLYRDIHYYVKTKVAAKQWRFDGCLKFFDKKMEEIALELAEYGVNIRAPENSRCLVPANMSTKSQSKLNSKNTSFNEKSPLIDLHEMMF